MGNDSRAIWPTMLAAVPTWGSGFIEAARALRNCSSALRTSCVGAAPNPRRMPVSATPTPSKVNIQNDQEANVFVLPSYKDAEMASSPSVSVINIPSVLPKRMLSMRLAGLSLNEAVKSARPTAAC